MEEEKQIYKELYNKFYDQKMELTHDEVDCLFEFIYSNQFHIYRAINKLKDDKIVDAYEILNELLVK